MTDLPAPDEVLTIANLRRAYADGRFTPLSVITEIQRRVDAYDDTATWISLVSKKDLAAAAGAATQQLKAGDKRPLLGVPFAVKDNIDVAGMNTTAACPQFAYRPAKHATAVKRLLDAGAILAGKTNLDQFATGLVGVRSPYGTPRNPLNSRYIPGGSSSGSAVAVSAGLVSFSLGTDTAGSGRVPAGFTNIVGLKPTKGRISTVGVVPACRSLDCISVFALTCEDAATVLSACEGYDGEDPFSRTTDEIGRRPPRFPETFRFGVPADDQLKFFGNTEYEAFYRQAVGYLKALGGTAVTIEFNPFVMAGRLLYEGPWLAERMAAAGKLLAERPDALLPVTRKILELGRGFDAASVYRFAEQLQSLRQSTRVEWARMDLLLLPTTGTIYKVEEIIADPITLNSNLGYYTNFVNLMNLSAVAVPAGIGSSHLPCGVTLMAPAGYESALLALGDRLHRAAGIPLGGTGAAMPSDSLLLPLQWRDTAMVRLAVVGAHLSGQPLNHQLTDLKATLVRLCKTAPVYRLVALPGTAPPKPGMIRIVDGGGSIEVEIWEMTAEAFGTFVAAIPPPLGIGTLQLEDGELVKGFLCEGYAVAGARDITHFGGWRAFLAAAAQ
jgi:allophanate hydrolase